MQTNVFRTHFKYNKWKLSNVSGLCAACFSYTLSSGSSRKLQMWPKLIAKAKEGGLDVIQTYVFWNVHEPIQGQVNALLSFIWMPVKAPEKYPVSERKVLRDV